MGIITTELSLPLMVSFSFHFWGIQFLTLTTRLQ